jgi:hypothetical protein
MCFDRHCANTEISCRQRIATYEPHRILSHLSQLMLREQSQNEHVLLAEQSTYPMDLLDVVLAASQKKSRGDV